MNNGLIKEINSRANYERICIIRNDISWIKKAIFGIFGGLILNIAVNLIT